MIKFILDFFKSKLISVFSKISIEDITNNTEKILNKALQKKEQLGKGKPVKKEGKKSEEKETIFYKFPFTFFYSDGKFQPIYFWVTVFSFLSSLMLYIKIYSAWVAIKNKTFVPDMLSTGDLGVVLGFIGSLILLYNSNKVKKNNGN